MNITQHYFIFIVLLQVNPGSVAEQCGLKAGDAVLSINDKSSDELEHEAAKREILMSGNHSVLKVQRLVTSIKAVGM